jgi:hypothetical protein
MVHDSPMNGAAERLLSQPSQPIFRWSSTSVESGLAKYSADSFRHHKRHISRLRVISEVLAVASSPVGKAAGRQVRIPAPLA